MAHTECTSIFEYLQPNKTFNDRNFTIIREQYQQRFDGVFPEVFDESVIDEVARQLKIQIDTAESQELLHECVLSSSIVDSRCIVKARLNSKIESLNTTTNDVTIHTPSPTVLTDIDCLLTVKTNLSKVSNFIGSFLLQPIDGPSLNWNIDQRSFIVNVQCPLYLFIQEQVREHGTIISMINRNGTRFRLIEPINSNDDFGPWHHDRWHGLFDLELESHDKKAPFPEQWCLAQDVKIYCRIETCNSYEKDSHSSHLDAPRTSNLKVFVQDVCKYEDIDRTITWLKELAREDIGSYEHLSSLNQSEWDRMNKLSMHARRILKAAVDQARTSIASQRRRQLIEDPNDENKEETKSSDAELLANLHLIKLFIWHKLRDQPAVRRHGALPKLEMKCLDMAFEEMQSDGFADDGLFWKIREFFLPLTISEQELKLERPINQGVRLTLREQLRQEIHLHKGKLNKMRDDDRENDKDMILIENMIEKHENECLQEQVTWKSSKNKKKQQKQLEDLHQRYQNSLKDHANFLKQRDKIKQKKDDFIKKINECQTEIKGMEARLQTIEMELNTPHKPVDKKLVKPPRGLIMYGPPGTGKSEILKTLADKLGIIMVGPPLAAGELNRSLVGESERVIAALCSRGQQVPYAMCCVSIDEIDSLAPKRDKDSSEGKIDKISVLLSMIEGIKDVPNLMILSATNRLHMMDEAFLRRVSGKFFVGRPSSNARLAMLREIPCWALEPELLDILAIATTNFSGAAVRALTKAMTSKCIERQRSDSSYQIGKIEALEIVDRIAQQYQIFIGSETLPCLLLRNTRSDTHHSHMYNLPENSKYTGRIVIDLHSRNIRVEISNTGQSSIIEHDLYPNEITVQTLLERLTNYGKCRNVQLLQLIDLNLLASQNAYDEKKVYETLKDRSEECVSYPRSMIVYDLDALVGVNKSESDSNMGTSSSSAIHNHSIYTYVLARFRDRVMDNVQKGSSEKIERWTIVVIREPFLLRQLCADVQYPPTRQEEKELELERRKANKRLKCVKCKDFYIENDNKMGNCVHHDGFLIDIEDILEKKYTPTEIASKFREIERSIIRNSSQHEELERQKKRYKWICCDETFTSVRAGGCKRDKHGFSSKTNQPIDRLTQTMIEEWEETCRNNEEYHEKWVMLMKEE